MRTRKSCPASLETSLLPPLDQIPADHDYETVVQRPKRLRCENFGYIRYSAPASTGGVARIPLECGYCHNCQVWARQCKMSRFYQGLPDGYLTVKLWGCSSLKKGVELRNSMRCSEYRFPDGPPVFYMVMPTPSWSPAVEEEETDEPWGLDFTKGIFAAPAYWEALLPPGTNLADYPCLLVGVAAGVMGPEQLPVGRKARLGRFIAAVSAPKGPTLPDALFPLFRQVMSVRMTSFPLSWPKSAPGRIRTYQLGRGCSEGPFAEPLRLSRVEAEPEYFQRRDLAEQDPEVAASRNVGDWLSRCVKTKGPRFMAFGEWRMLMKGSLSSERLDRLLTRLDYRGPKSLWKDLLHAIRTVGGLPRRNGTISLKFRDSGSDSWRKKSGSTAVPDGWRDCYTVVLDFFETLLGQSRPAGWGSWRFDAEAVERFPDCVCSSCGTFAPENGDAQWGHFKCVACGEETPVYFAEPSVIEQRMQVGLGKPLRRAPA